MRRSLAHYELLCLTLNLIGAFEMNDNLPLICQIDLPLISVVCMRLSGLPFFYFRTGLQVFFTCEAKQF